MGKRVCGCCTPPGPTRAVPLRPDEEALGEDGSLIAAYQCGKTGIRTLTILSRAMIRIPPYPKADPMSTITTTSGDFDPHAGLDWFQVPGLDDVVFIDRAGLPCLQTALLVVLYRKGGAWAEPAPAGTVFSAAEAQEAARIVMDLRKVPLAEVEGSRRGVCWSRNRHHVRILQAGPRAFREKMPSAEDAYTDDT